MNCRGAPSIPAKRTVCSDATLCAARLSAGSSAAERALQRPRRRAMMWAAPAGSSCSGAKESMT
eukprot:3957334-Pyramimonas_sp.AAC.1